MPPSRRPATSSAPFPTWPPERFRGEGDARVDIYGLGLTLYELLTLESAFDAADRMRLIEQVKSEDPIRPRLRDRRIPRDLETIVLKAIDKDPHRRYATADAMADDLRRFLDDEPILARRASLLERYGRWARRHPGVAILGAVLTAVLVVATVVSLTAASQFRTQAAQQTIVANEREVQRKKAEVSRAEAEKARREAETVVVDMHAARGFLAAERGDAARAMLWFAKAAELASRDAERERLNRIRSQAWEREAVVPIIALNGAGRDLKSVDFRPGGGHLLTLSVDGMLRVWRLDDGSEVKLPGIDRRARIAAAAWSPDGAFLAVGRAESRVEVFRIANVSSHREFDFPGPATAVAFSHDGSLLGAAGAEARVWNLADGKGVSASMPHPKPVTSLEFSKQGNRFLTSSADGSWRVFDVRTSDGASRLEGRSRDLVRPAAPRFSADGKAVLSLSDPTLLTWTDTDSGRPTGPGQVRLDLRTAIVIDLSADGRWFAAGGYCGPQLFSVDKTGPAPRMLSHGNEVTSCRFSADSKLLVTSSWDRTVKLWSLPGGELVGAPLPHEQIVHGAAFSPDSLHLATWQQGGLVRIWRLPTRGRAISVPGPVYFTAHPRKSGDGRRMIAGRFLNPFNAQSLGSSPMAVRDIASGRPIGPQVLLPGDVHDAALNADGRHAAALVRAPEGGSLHVWDVATGLPVFEPLPQGTDPISVDFSPDSTRIATHNESGSLRIIDAANGRTVGSYRTTTPEPDNRGRVRFVNARKLVVLNSGRLVVIGLAEDKLTARTIPVRGDQGFVSVLAISADGRYAATAVGWISEYPVRIWDLATGKPVSPPLVHPDEVYYVAFSTDGRRVVTGGRDGQLRVWDWASGKLTSPPCTTDDEILHFALTPDGRFAVAGVRKGIGPGKVEVWELASGKRMIPSVMNSLSVHGLALSVDGRRALALLGQGGVDAINLADLVDPDPRPTAELVRLGELASGQRVLDGDLMGLTTEEWLDRWRVATPRFHEATPPEPVPESTEPTLRHAPPRSPVATAKKGTGAVGWVAIAQECMETFRADTSHSSNGFIAATYALLAGDDDKYREVCRLMMRNIAGSERIDDLERTAKVCLIGKVSLPEAQLLAAKVGAQLDAGNVPEQFVPWGHNLMALAALRDGRFEEACRWADRVEASLRGSPPLTSAVRAMAEQGLGRHPAALLALERAQAAFGGDFSGYISWAAIDPDASAKCASMADPLFMALLVREAEAKVLLEPYFPVDPFAPK